MSGQGFLATCATVSSIVLSASMAITILRIALGPSTADRLLGLAMLFMTSAGFVAVVAAGTGIVPYADLVVALSLAVPLSVAAAARHVVRTPDGDERGRP